MVKLPVGVMNSKEASGVDYNQVASRGDKPPVSIMQRKGSILLRNVAADI